MTVSRLSTRFIGSYMTRLLKHGAAGNTVEMVAVSWIEKPCGRSSRCMAFRMPPDFGLDEGGWLIAGAPTTIRTTTMRTRSDATRCGGDIQPPSWRGARGGATKRVHTEAP